MEFLDFLSDVYPIDDEHIIDQLWEIVCESDREFIPPLSERESTSQSNLNRGLSDEIRPKKYFSELLKQSFIVISEDKKVLGFMSFKNRYMCEDLINIKDKEFCYITTVIVKKQYRGKSLTQQMYNHLFEIMGNGRDFVTRTWSTNHAHISILNRLKFDVILSIPDGRGEGIDTVYFCKNGGEVQNG